MDKKKLYEYILLRSTSSSYSLHAPQDITKITKYVYLGNLDNAINVHKSGIPFKYMLNLTTTTYTPTLPGVTVIHIPLLDDNVTDVTKYFDDIVNFLNNCENRQMPVLVHCVAGVNRSGVIIAAYLLSRRNANIPPFVYFLYIIHGLREKRGAFVENDSFKKQLIRYYITK
ncbi:Tyr/Ser phosphatase [Sea otter poxvirus]|uniref:Tyr/Ser phosphatase n=1 Tax=Sea otter poxvirus TaxID=1416741 RepID=A0A2U9QHP0_9POXV|nr:Tyr/Ser phosphatase [Sea otter poxvirus]AWU47115.1 Tyr/Ser phosphatase [Sea otter poxvirus]